MNKWLALLAVAGGLAAIIGALLAVAWWLGRRYERAHGIGPDDGGRLRAASPIDHLALDRAHHDADSYHG